MNSIMPAYYKVCRQIVVKDRKPLPAEADTFRGQGIPGVEGSNENHQDIFYAFDPLTPWISFE
jgi:hypothetical protein